MQGGGAQADLVGEVHIADPAIVLQGSEDADVQFVQGAFPAVGHEFISTVNVSLFVVLA
jgi:hypothetical protein